MKYTITGKQIEVTAAIRDYVEEKIARLDKYTDEITSLKVNLKMVEHKFSAEVVVSVPRSERIVAADKESDLYAAIDLVMDKIDRRLRKHKEKLKRHRPRKSEIRKSGINVTEMTEE